jgi:hypothetical protein
VKIWEKLGGRGGRRIMLDDGCEKTHPYPCLKPDMSQVIDETR